MAEGEAVTPEEGAAMASQWGLPFFSTSSMSGDNVEEAFRCMATGIKRLKLDQGSTRERGEEGLGFNDGEEAAASLSRCGC